MGSWNVCGVERFHGDAHYYYLDFKENTKVKQRRYIRRNVKLNCIVEETIGCEFKVEVEDDK